MDIPLPSIKKLMDTCKENKAGKAIKGIVKYKKEGFINPIPIEIPAIRRKTKSNAKICPGYFLILENEILSKGLLMSNFSIKI